MTTWNSLMPTMTSPISETLDAALCASLRMASTRRLMS
jgi:hypothetical protein